MAHEREFDSIAEGLAGVSSIAGVWRPASLWSDSASRVRLEQLLSTTIIRDELDGYSLDPTAEFGWAPGGESLDITLSWSPRGENPDVPPDNLWFVTVFAGSPSWVASRGTSSSRHERLPVARTMPTLIDLAGSAREIAIDVDIQTLE